MISKIFQAASKSNMKSIYTFSRIPNFAQGNYDYANVMESIQAPSPIIVDDMMTKFSIISPSALYDKMDLLSRDLLFYLSDDLGWGMGLGILAISVGIKILFGPMMFQAQLNGIRMKLIEPEMKNYQNMSQRLMRAQDMKAVRVASKQFKQFKHKHKINMVIPALSMLQMPFLITWFLSLRYVLYLPDKFEGARTQGFLWFKDLSDYDPYGILPIMSAMFTFWNISLNPNMASQSSVPFAKYYRYMRFLPFFSIPVVIFFPSGLNLYWCSSAFCHLVITAISRSAYIRKLCGIPQFLPGTILERQNMAQQPNVLKAHIHDYVKNIDNIPAQKIVDNLPQGKIADPTVKIFSQKPKRKQK